MSTLRSVLILVPTLALAACSGSSGSSSASIVSFTASSAQVAIGEPLTFEWMLEGASGNGLVCSLDFEDDGKIDQMVADCGDVGSVTYAFTNGGSYRPHLRLSSGQQVIAEARVPVAVDGPQIILLSPDGSRPEDRDLRVEVEVDTNVGVVEAVAEVEGIQRPMVFAGSSYSTRLNLSSLAWGMHTVIVRATDLDGVEALIECDFLLDEAPDLTLIEPRYGDVASPFQRIRATCVDDSPSGECNIEVRVRVGTATPDFLGFFPAPLDEIFDLSAYIGRQINVELTARDSSGQPDFHRAEEVYVVDNPPWSAVENAPGPILEVRDDRLLYLEFDKQGERKLGIQDAGGPLVIDDLGDRDFVRSTAFLTSEGALYRAEDPTTQTTRLYEWSPAGIDDLGLGTPTATAGEFALWARPGPPLLFELKDYTSGMVESFGDPTVLLSDVDPSGRVVYLNANGDLASYFQGTTQVLAQRRSLPLFGPLIADRRVVYSERDVSCDPDDDCLATWLFTGAGPVRLTGSFLENRGPGAGYQIAGDWVAFTRPGSGGVIHVWRRDLAGNEEQLTPFLTPSRLDALAENGEAMLKNDGVRYLARLDGSLTALGSSRGDAFWADDQWFVLLGRSVFEVLIP